MHKLIVPVAVALALVSPALAQTGASDASIEKAAAHWLALVDHGDYAASWSEAGDLFHSHISTAEWAKTAAPTRQPLGPLLSRKLDTVEEKTSLPGAPDGLYAIVRFDAAFAHKDKAVETVILAQQKGGWAVDGYFIR